MKSVNHVNPLFNKIALGFKDHASIDLFKHSLTEYRPFLTELFYLCRLSNCIYLPND